VENIVVLSRSETWDDLRCIDFTKRTNCHFVCVLISAQLPALQQAENKE